MCVAHTAVDHGGRQLRRPLRAALVLVTAAVQAAYHIPGQIVQHHAPIDWPILQLHDVSIRQGYKPILCSVELKSKIALSVGVSSGLHQRRCHWTISERTASNALSKRSSRQAEDELLHAAVDINGAVWRQRETIPLHNVRQEQSIREREKSQRAPPGALPGRW